jgi:hypothetical protein
VARCDGRWFHRVNRKTEDGRDLSNRYDLTPLFEGLEALAEGQDLPQASVAKRPRVEMNGTKVEINKEAQELFPAAPVHPGQDTAVETPLTLATTDSWGISLRKWIVGEYVEVIAERRLPVIEDRRQFLAERFAAWLKPEHIQAVAAKFPGDELTRVVAKEQGTSFSEFARAILDEYAPFLNPEKVTASNDDGEATTLSA